MSNEAGVCVKQYRETVARSFIKVDDIGCCSTSLGLPLILPRSDDASSCDREFRVDIKSIVRKRVEAVVAFVHVRERRRNTDCL